MLPVINQFFEARRNGEACRHPGRLARTVAGVGKIRSSTSWLGGEQWVGDARGNLLLFVLYTFFFPPRRCHRERKRLFLLDTQQCESTVFPPRIFSSRDVTPPPIGSLLFFPAVDVAMCGEEVTPFLTVA